MSTKVRAPKAQEDDDLSPPRRKTATTDHFSPPRRGDSSPPRQESSPPRFQSAKSKRRCLSEHQEKLAERYAQWNRGLAQVRQSEDAVKHYLEQSDKPLARYRNDKDLDAMLIQKERQDDPMLKYISNKTSNVADRLNNINNDQVKPRYRGHDPQTNRFNIWPGYRWDGINRSNVEPPTTGSTNFVDYGDIPLCETVQNKLASFVDDTLGGVGTLCSLFAGPFILK